MILMILVATIQAIVGLSLLVLGILILRRKPVIVRGYMLTVLLAICFLPMLCGPVWMVVAGPFGIANIGIALLLILMYAVLVFVFSKSFGNLMLFNVDEDLVYESLYGVLDERGIEYEERRGRIIMPSSDSAIRISTQGVFATAIIHFHNRGESGVAAEVTRALKQSLAKRSLGKFPYVGLLYLAFGLFMVAFLAGMVGMFAWPIAG